MVAVFVNVSDFVQMLVDLTVKVKSSPAPGLPKQLQKASGGDQEEEIVMFIDRDDCSWCVESAFRSKMLVAQ